MYTANNHIRQNSFQSVAQEQTIQQKSKKPIQLVDNRDSSKKVQSIFSSSSGVIQKGDKWKTEGLKKEHEQAKGVKGEVEETNETHTLHHKVGKAKLESHYKSLPDEEKEKMLTSMGFEKTAGVKSIKSFRPNLTLGKAPQERSIEDPGEDFDGNVTPSGASTPRSKHLKGADALLAKEVKTPEDIAAINKAFAEALKAHGDGGLDTKSNKTEIDEHQKKLQTA